MNMFSRILLAVSLMLASCLQPLLAAPDIRVNGLFPGRAMLTINGTPRLLKVGQTSPEGVELLASDSQQAEVRVDGVKYKLGVSDHIASSFKPAEFSEVRMSRDADGHYRTFGSINGRSVEFMVDTGASAIALNMNDAKRLGVDLRRGRQGQASTAGGLVNTFEVLLPKVTVGSITLHNVPAVVVVGNFPANVLLGNSFLQRVEMQEQAGVMVLRSKL